MKSILGIAMAFEKAVGELADEIQSSLKPNLEKKNKDAEAQDKSEA